MEGRSTLNLARSWRPQTFSEVVGQSLAISLLVNGLKKRLLFPVYLLAGLRGSGKTSVARIFAAALNCSQLPAFERGEWQGVFPCLSCPSCRAMRSGEHPDFIEIDAASHTGVDHVRQLIEEATFLPVLGVRKVYLIDETHMLSKAAFNAFLKILEEPPATVHFLLATTDPQKVIETVRSRSFQLFFDPIPEEALLTHLAAVCAKEGIDATNDGLRLICRESGGSVRDALNILERVRLAVDEVNQESVGRLLGYIDDGTLITLVEKILGGELSELLEWLKQMQVVEVMSVEAVWGRLVDIFRALVWEAAGVPLPLFQHSTQERIRELARHGDAGLFVELLDMLYKVEGSLQRTTAQRALLERILFMLAQRCAAKGTGDGSLVPRSSGAAEKVRSEREPVQTVAKERVEEKNCSAGPKDAWALFVERYGRSGDALLASVFAQGICGEVQDGMVRVVFPAQFVFYQEHLVSQKAVWQPLFDEIFGEGALLVPEFSGQKQLAKKEIPSGLVGVRERSEQKIDQRPIASSGSFGATHKSAYDSKIQVRPKEPQRRVVTVGEGEEWRRTREVLSVFPGVVTVVEEKT